MKAIDNQNVGDGSRQITDGRGTAAIKDSRAEAKQAKMSLDIMSSSQQVKQAKALNALMNSVQSGSVSQLSQGPVAQLAILNQYTKSYQTAGLGRAKSVEVKNLAGTTYGPGYHNPTVTVYGWDQLRNEGHTLGAPNSTHYNAVKMHLWSGRADGPGNDKKNLVPGPANVNSKMSADPEAYLKNNINQGNRMWLKTEVQYAQNTNDPTDYQNVVPNKIKMEVGKMKKGKNYAKIHHSAPFATGPATKTWTQDIWLPGDSITHTQKNSIKNFSGKNQVDNMLAYVQNFSLQQLAATYTNLRDSVHKKALMEEYPDLFEHLGPAQQANYLGLFAPGKIPDLLNNVHNMLGAKDIVA